MINKIVKLNKDNPKIDIPINIENPYFKFIGLNEKNKFDFQKLNYNLKLGNSVTKASISNYETHVIDVNGAKSITFELNLNSNDEVDFELEFQYSLFDYIDLNSPLLEFDKHIDSSINTKIFFSAAFGQGKTFFLDYFFDERKEDYNVFKVFPVNYPIAENNDIFKCIKVDLLFQLLSKGAELESEISKSLQIESYITYKTSKLILPILKIFSAIGGNPFSNVFLKSIDILNKTIEENVKFIPSEKSLIEQYINDVFEEEGSLFEDNLVSQIIRQLLEQIKLQNQLRKNVLIIEDLDRLDPEHIFRILNVISAHFDEQRHNQFESHNKFGFDKIILVGDINNILSIFMHKYGKNADFNGYMNKFYSSEIFHYDNLKMYPLLINRICDGVRSYDSIFKFLLEPLIEKGHISLRELFKLKSLGLKKEVERIQNLSHTKHVWLLRNIYTPSLSLLLKQFSQMRLIGYFEVIFELKDELVYDHHCRFLISSFHEKYQNSNYKVKKIKSQEFPLIYKIDYNSSGDFGYVNNFYKVNDTGDIVSFNDFEFKKEDFFFLLTENINLIALHL